MCKSIVRKEKQISNPAQSLIGQLQHDPLKWTKLILNFSSQKYLSSTISLFKIRTGPRYLIIKNKNKKMAKYECMHFYISNLLLSSEGERQKEKSHKEEGTEKSLILSIVVLTN